MGEFYGVHALLEHVGVRWFDATPLGEVVPKQKTLKIGPIDEADSPDFDYREYNTQPIRNLKLKINGLGCEMLLGTRNPRAANAYGHNYTELIGGNAHFEAHPEWYPLIHGKRRRRELRAHRYVLPTLSR